MAGHELVIAGGSRMCTCQLPLVCAFDLDNTLVHNSYEEQSGEDVHRIQYSSVKGGRNSHVSWIKVRPGARELLRKAAENYEMYVSTLGTRPYALAVLDVLDPGSLLVPRYRVMSRTDTKRNSRKTLMDFVWPLRLEKPDHASETHLWSTRTCIVDDRVDVWGEFACNVLPVLPFEHFQRKSTRLLPCTTHTDALIDGPDVMSHTAKTLDALAQTFLRARLSCTGCVTSNCERSLPQMLMRLRSSTLQSCVVAFSGIYTTTSRSKRSCVVRQLALELGATCVEGTDEQIRSGLVTHLVCARAYTSKYVAAHQSKAVVYIVRPEWLYRTASVMVRADENFYLLTGPETRAKSKQAAEEHVANDFMSLQKRMLTTDQPDVTRLNQHGKRKHSLCEDDIAEHSTKQIRSA